MPEYFLCLDLLLLTRLVYLHNDDAIGIRGNLFLTAAQCLLLLLFFSANMTLLLIGLILLIAGALNLLFESRLVKRGWRLGILLLLVLGIDLINGASAGLALRPGLTGIFMNLADISALLQLDAGESGARLAVLAFGLLLLTNEINLFVRLVFHQFGLEPANEVLTPGDALPPQGKPISSGDASVHGIDKAEYNAGRVIGILERWLMYLVVLSTSNLGAIAFIIAAKGLARMKQLEEKAFAEYMLIGTLLSVLSAVLIGKWILSLLAGPVLAWGP